MRPELHRAYTRAAQAVAVAVAVVWASEAQAALEATATTQATPRQVEQVERLLHPAAVVAEAEAQEGTRLVLVALVVLVPLERLASRTLATCPAPVDYVIPQRARCRANRPMPIASIMLCRRRAGTPFPYVATTSCSCAVSFANTRDAQMSFGT